MYTIGIGIIDIDLQRDKCLLYTCVCVRVSARCFLSFDTTQVLEHLQPYSKHVPSWCLVLGKRLFLSFLLPPLFPSPLKQSNFLLEEPENRSELPWFYKIWYGGFHVGSESCVTLSRHQ